MSLKRKVLIVEDEFILYEQLAEFCEESGYQVIGLPDSAPVDTYEVAVDLAKKYKPDLALLDIGIKGEKDGIELGTFLRRHYSIPVVYISGRNNQENRNRIRDSGSASLVIKIGKPLNKEQLIANLDFALSKSEKQLSRVVPLNNNGNFFSGKKVLIDESIRQKRVITQNQQDDLDIETFIKWEQILFFESYNKKSADAGNNNLLLHFTENKDGLIIKGSLNALCPQLPSFFIRFDQSTVVNFKKVTGRNSGKTVYYIGDLFFKITDAYRKSANDQIDLFLGDNEPDFD